MENKNEILDYKDNNIKNEEIGTFVKRYSIVNKDPKIEKIANLMSEVLNIINPELRTSSNTLKTPVRFAEAIVEFTSGYDEHLDDKILKAIFDSENYDEIITVKDIVFSSLCEHHILPFFGQVSIGYIPNGKILGLSKFPRLVETLAKKLHLQERLTKEIADAINKYLNPKGVVVIIEASHSCMSLRGVKSFASKTKTMYTLGVFKEDNHLNNFMSLIK